MLVEALLQLSPRLMSMPVQLRVVGPSLAPAAVARAAARAPVVAPHKMGGKRRPPTHRLLDALLRYSMGDRVQVYAHQRVKLL
jgi:hypothetical protein